VAIASSAGGALAAEAVRTNSTPGLGDYDLPFYPDGSYRDDVESPSQFLGFELGARPATYDQIIAYFTYLADNFSGVNLTSYATSYEGRELVYLTVTSADNARRLREIRKNIAKLADPRTLGKGDNAEKIIAETPAIAWMAYGIHGDELSSCDAALQLAYQLVAGVDDVTRLIREEVVVCIDPTENPDGRARWMKQLEQWNSVVTNPDIQSFQHTGTWPYGRGNHYLFDLNRDWFAQVHPETRGRIEALTGWHPQFVLDCHEMGPTDTYLFSPPREPFNPYMIKQIYKWWDIYAKDLAASLDRYGWSYYTREWNEELFPGYGSSWGIYGGAIGMLYEQAGVDGSQVKRPDGTIMTYRETVHRQFTSSMANLGTTAARSEELLKDYYAEKRRDAGLDGSRRGAGAAFVFPPSSNRSRMLRFAEGLERQGIDVDVANADFQMKGARSDTGGDATSVRVAKGSLIVKLDQPMRPLIEAILAFDIRIPTSFLETERREVIKYNRTRLYQVTGWSLPLAYNIESYYVDALPAVDTRPFDADDFRLAVALAEGEPPSYGYAFSNEDDGAYALLARLFEHDVRVWAAREPFQVDGRRFERGSFVIRVRANQGLKRATLAELAQAEGVEVFPVNSALGGDLADLGGNQFVLLRPPHVAIVGGANVSTYGFGSTWHLLDSRLRYRTTTLDIDRLARADLRKYNVIILPSSWFDGVYDGALGKSGLKNLKDWVQGGGTLVALGGAAAFCADSSNALASVRQKRQVLGKLDDYDYALHRLEMGEDATIDSLDVWEAKKPEAKPGEKKPVFTKQEIKRADELARTLRPRGAILAGDVDDTNWLCYGVRGPLPVMVTTGYAYVAQGRTQVAVRFAPEAHLRLSGVLWPEARARWAETAYATRDRLGNGQVLLFADEPNFRAYFYGGQRLLLNAIFLGPGFGTDTAIEW